MEESILSKSIVIIIMTLIISYLIIFYSRDDTVNEKCCNKGFRVFFGVVIAFTFLYFGFNNFLIIIFKGTDQFLSGVITVSIGFIILLLVWIDDPTRAGTCG